MLTSKLNECGLVKTKYSIPRVSPYVFSRAHLHKKLSGALNRKLTLVIAPVGYGKTTAVYEWLTATEVPSAWLTLDESDNSPLIFWKYVFAALDQVDPGILNEAEYLFTSVELLKANVQINMAINRLAALDKDFVLVLDDLHLVTNATIMSGLSYLVRFMPAQMHLVLMGRAVPKLSLVQDEFKSQILRIGAKDLQFSAEDIVQFFDLRERTFDTGSIRQIESYTAGWPAALVALAIALENNAEARIDQCLNACMGNCWNCIESYVLGEVVDTYSEEKRDFLLKVSILDCLCMDLCIDVTGNSNGAKIIEEMNQRNEFIMSYDEDRCMYRFNSIFKEILFKELSRSRFEILPDLYAKAAAWCKKEALYLKAILYYIRGGKFEEAVILIEDQLAALASKNEYDLAISYIEQLPESYREKSVRIAGFYTMYYAERRQLEQALAWSDRTFKLAQEVSDSETAVSAMTLARMTKAYLLIRLGDMDKLRHLFGEMEFNAHVFKRLGHPFDFNRSDLHFYRSPIHKITRLLEGDPEHLIHMQKVLRAVLPYDPGYLSLAKGEYCYEKNQLDEALTPLIAAAEAGVQSKSPGVFVPAMVSMARVRRARKDWNGMLQALDKCEHELQSIHQLHWNYQVDAFRVRHRIDMGETDTLSDWIQVNKMAVYNEINSSTEYVMIVYARALLALKLNEDAEVLLLRLLAFSDREDRLHSSVEILVLLAVLFNERAQMSKAADYMMSAVETSLREGFVRSLLDEGEGLIHVLKEALAEIRKRDSVPAELMAYSKEILEALHTEHMILTPGRSKEAGDDIKRLLTPKEMEVLALLVAAHTNEEIGSRLHIGLRTVKTHTTSIYSKLGVASRSQCIRFANELQLFEVDEQVVH